MQKMVFIKFMLFALIKLYFNCDLTDAIPFFPWNSTHGVFAALAIPLNLPHREVFISYNFEANYNSPYTWDIPPILIFGALAITLDLPNKDVFMSYNFEANYNLPYIWDIPPILEGIENEAWFEHEMERSMSSADCSNCTTTAAPFTATNSTADSTTSAPSKGSTSKRSTDKTAKQRQRRSLLTRRHFYYILKDKFERHGLNGEACLLRLICETNASELGEINGVLGSLVHILFSPSTSMQEHLPLRFYQAEVDGQHENCEPYEKQCDQSLLDLISSPLEEIVAELEEKVHENVL